MLDWPWMNIHSAADLKIRLFADGADLQGMLKMYSMPWIQGFTTNPTLIRKAGISDYAAFAQQVVQSIPDRPISFEVFSDDFAEMERQAMEMAHWGSNVYVKIPITNTRGESSVELCRRLAARGLKLNVTALMTLQQVHEIAAALAGGPPAYVSVFAGRAADTGVDPVPLMRTALGILAPYPNIQLIWASPRELLNIVQADTIGCHIITVTYDLLAKLDLLGKDLAEYSLDTVKMFYRDAQASGFQI
jgi:transaldolase